MQHCGLPICNYSKNVTHRSVEIKVEADAEWLLSNYNGWDFSKLDRYHGRLDLIKLTEEYYQHLVHTVGPFLAKAFFPKIVDAHNFFARLSLEVTRAAPDHKMVFYSELSLPGNKLTVQTSHVPIDLFTEIGIQVTLT